MRWRCWLAFPSSWQDEREDTLVIFVINSPSWYQKRRGKGKNWLKEERENKVELIGDSLGPIINKEEGEIHNASYKQGTKWSRRGNYDKWECSASKLLYLLLAFCNSLM